MRIAGSGALAIATLVGVAALLSCRPAPRPESAEGLYRFFCARCHGPDGRGTARQLRNYPAADLRRSEAIARGDRAAVRERTAAGHGPMPPFRDKLTPAELEKVTDYALALAAPAGGPGGAGPAPGGGTWIPSD